MLRSVDAMTDKASAVRLNGVSKTFGTVRAVDRLDLDIEPGQAVALLGPNGAGKSTTIGMMLGLSRPDSPNSPGGGWTSCRVARRSGRGSRSRSPVTRS